MVLLDKRESFLLGKEQTEPSKDSKRSFRDWIIPAIMFAQVSWTFAGVMTHGTVVLPDSKAAWIQNNPSDAHAIVTLLSTVFALVSSSLLGKAVQYALVRRLSAGPLGLDMMVEWARLAQHAISVNVDRRRLSWTLLSITWIGVLGFLTTAWSTLLAPESVKIYNSLQGFEVDLFYPSLTNLFFIGDLEPPPGYNLTPSDTDMLMNMVPGIVSDGWMRRGVYPQDFLLIPPNDVYRGVGAPPYLGFERTYNATQHGFTANVSCRLPTPNDPAIVFDLTNSVEVYAYTYDTYSWSTNCSSRVTYSIYGVTIINGIFLGGPNQPPGENKLLMTSVFRTGLYWPVESSFLVLLDGPTNSSYHTLRQVCEVTPLVTIVQTTYDGSEVVNVLQPPLGLYTLPNPTSANDTGILMWFPAFMIWTVFVRSQGLTANMIWNNLYGFMNGDYTSMAENYLRGMMEYLASLMASLVQPPNGVGAEGMIQFNGTINARTYGWTFYPRTHGPSLVVITLVTILTIVAGAYVMVPISGRDDGAGKKRWALRGTLVEGHGFDPTATMDVLLASSAGDLAQALSELDNSHGRGYDDELSVMLGRTEKGAPALRTVGGDRGRVGASDSELTNRDEFVQLVDLRTGTEVFD